MAERLRALLVANGALVFMVGLVAGFPFTFVILGKIVLWPLPGALGVHLPGDVRGWRMAHLEGILNGLTLIAVAAAAPCLTLLQSVCSDGVTGAVGHIHQSVRLRAERVIETRMLVDTGATFTVIPHVWRERSG